MHLMVTPKSFWIFSSSSLSPPKGALMNLEGASSLLMISSNSVMEFAVIVFCSLCRDAFWKRVSCILSKRACRDSSRFSRE